jgi:outer membrane protein OmpA-like peptidoglycan-associated protein
MAKKVLYPVGIILTIIIGSFLYRSYCCDCAKQKVTVNESPVYVPPVEVKEVSIPPAEPAKPDWNELKKKINIDPLTFYFNSNQSGISLTEQEKTKIADIITYLENVSEGTVIVTGYTDNSGSREKNLKLGQDRAEFIKTYLVNNGISGSKITAASKGPDDAVAGNETEEGKAKNRRTIVLIN